MAFDRQRFVSSLLEQLRVLVESVILTLGYPGIALVMLIENLFPPIPSEVVVPFAGFLVAQGVLSFWGVMVATTLGAVLGALVLYGLGAWLGASRLRLFFSQYGRWFLLSEEDFDRALTCFNRHDRSIIFWARLMPGVRSLISIPAGVARMRIGRFLFFTTLGTLAWNLALGSAGVFLGQNWELVLAFIDRFEIMFWLLLAVLVVWWATRRIIHERAPVKQ